MKITNFVINGNKPYKKYNGLLIPAINIIRIIDYICGETKTEMDTNCSILILSYL